MKRIAVVPTIPASLNPIGMIAMMGLLMTTLLLGGCATDEGVTGWDRVPRAANLPGEECNGYGQCIAPVLVTYPEPISKTFAEYSCGFQNILNIVGAWHDIVIGDMSNPQRGQTDANDPNIVARSFMTTDWKIPQNHGFPPSGGQWYIDDFSVAGTIAHSSANVGGLPPMSQLYISENEVTGSFDCRRINNGVALPAAVRRALGESVP
ncbi:MAG: hypothetical protein ACYCOU_14870 [Sulfobacillus sp.]